MRRWRVARSSEVGDRLGQVSDRDRLHTRERNLGTRLGGANDPPETSVARSLGGDESAGDGPQPPVERELADRGMAGERALRDLMRGFEHRQGDRQVEAGSLLPKIGRRKVDDDPVPGPVELGRGDPTPNSLFRLLACAVGEPDDRKGGCSALEERLDLDPSGIEADQGMGDGSREYVGKLDD